MEQAERGLLFQIEQFAREQCAGHDPAHDSLHLDRVVSNATHILHDEDPAGGRIDHFAALAACWLHDIVQLPKGTGPPGEAARRSAELAGRCLSELDIPEDRRELIAQAIEAHSFSGGLAPPSIEAAILQDADRLDALGAVGIARLWVSAAGRGSQLYDGNDPAAERRPHDDARYALDHITTKLLRLPDTMHTEAGRHIARDRAALIVTYRDQFLREIT